MKIFLFLLAIFIFIQFIPLELAGQSEILQIGKSQIHTFTSAHQYPASNPETKDNDQWLKAKKIAAQRRDEYFKTRCIIPSKSHPVFTLPLKVKEANSDPEYFTITRYFDHDTLYPNHLLDYNCGKLTYDLESGYNHKGTDFFLWPYPWYKMENDQVEVVAAAPGMILLKQDGNFDQHCEENGEPWNGLCLLHEDGSTSWYVHLKENSLLDLSEGEYVSRGEYLGIVGSSGSSLAPHLHFEVLDSEFKAIDPFLGSCNSTVTESWWEVQLPYMEPGINKISTHAHLPVFPECPQSEIPNESDVFYPGDSIFFLAFFRNISLGEHLEVKILKPDNSVFASWNWVNPLEFQPASWTFFLVMLDDFLYGIWTYQVIFNGVIYTKAFELKEPQIVADIAGQAIEIYPSPFKKSFNIVFTSNTNLCTISVFNHLGQLVHNIKDFKDDENVFSIDLSGFQSGPYHVLVIDDHEIINRTIIKQ